MKRRIIITGATSGIGMEMAKGLVGKDYELILGCRDLDKAGRIWDEIIEENPETDISYKWLDLASFESIRRFADQMHDMYGSLDVLVNNAGVFMETMKKTEEGFEMTMGVNYLGTYHLTRLLEDLLSHGKTPQIINVCSRAAFFGHIKYTGMMFENHPPGFRAYSASKRMLLMATLFLSEQYKDRGIAVNAIHPGKVATGIWKGETLLMKWMGRINLKRYDSPVDAAKTGLHLVENDEIRSQTGQFYEKEGVRIPIRKSLSDSSKIKKLIASTDETISKIKQD